MHGRHLVEDSRVQDLQPGLEQLGPDHEREQATDQEHQQREHQVHRPDVLVVRGRQPAHDAFRRSVRVVVVVARVCHRIHSVAASAGVAAVFCSSSQASNSSLGFATTTIGMKPWSAPQSSAHWPR